MRRFTFPRRADRIQHEAMVDVASQVRARARVEMGKGRLYPLTDAEVEENSRPFVDIDVGPQTKSAPARLAPPGA